MANLAVPESADPGGEVGVENRSDACANDPDSRLDPEVLARKVSDGELGRGELNWLQEGFAKWQRALRVIPLHQCLGLSARRDADRLSRRSELISKAACMLVAEGSNEVSVYGQSVLVCAALHKFVTRAAVYREWCERGEPPSDASGLYVVLFEIAKLSGGAPISRATIERQLRSQILSSI